MDGLGMVLAEVQIAELHHVSLFSTSPRRTKMSERARNTGSDTTNSSQEADFSKAGHGQRYTVGR